MLPILCPTSSPMLHHCWGPCKVLFQCMHVHATRDQDSNFCGFPLLHMPPPQTTIHSILQDPPIFSHIFESLWVWHRKWNFPNGHHSFAKETKSPSSLAFFFQLHEITFRNSVYPAPGLPRYTIFEYGGSTWRLYSLVPLAL